MFLQIRNVVVPTCCNRISLMGEALIRAGGTDARTSSDECIGETAACGDGAGGTCWDEPGGSGAMPSCELPAGTADNIALSIRRRRRSGSQGARQAFGPT